LWLLERRRPLRGRVEPTGVHGARNLAIAAVGSVAVQLVEQPIVAPLSRRVDRRRCGLLPRLQLPRPLEALVAIALLDYTLYLWHILVHRAPMLWRFHRVHHVDLDLDASTALRFHFGELALSTPWRAAQVVVIGVRPEVLRAWQQMTLVSILFHHSNVRLPGRLERLLSLLVMTPRLHGIHHSNRADEMDANWSSGLSVWDRLHRTLRTDVREEAITIGVEGVSEPRQVTLRRALAMPFALDQEPVREDEPASR
jgi:sterol desaturase/sphingolipid hydroxylase (fatty acid hydroxylase superfamily)